MKSLLLTLLLIAPCSLVFGQKGDLQAKDSEQEPPQRKLLKNVSGVLRLLKTELVQKELALTDSQKEKIVELQRKLRDPYKGSKKVEEVNAEQEKELELILQPRQINRVLEIMLQMVNPLIFFDTDIGKYFDLTEDQKEKIKKIVNDARESGKSIGGGTPTTHEQHKERFEKQQSILKEVGKKIEKVLTPKQLDILAKMKGKEIDTAKLSEEIADTL